MAVFATSNSATDGQANLFWTGAGNGAHSTAKISDNAPTTSALSVGVQGTGSGGVETDTTSRRLRDLGGINCGPHHGSQCSASYPTGSTLMLIARPDPGSVFTGWTGACHDQGAVCHLDVNGPTGTTAIFAPVTHQLTLVTQGSGAVLNADGLGVSGSYTLPADSLLRYTAQPGAGSHLAGWSGACQHSQPVCELFLSADKTLQATFTDSSATTQLRVIHSADGQVFSHPGGISCGEDCSEHLPPGTAITLTAVPRYDKAFASWAGCTPTDANPCHLTLNGDTQVHASFTPRSADEMLARRIIGYYMAYFLRVPDAHELTYWSDQAQQGVTSAQISAYVGQPQFAEDYPSVLSHAEFVRRIFQNLLGISLQSGDLAYWSATLDQGSSRPELIGRMLDLILTLDLDALLGQGRIDLDTYAQAKSGQAALKNKIEAALYFVQTLGSASNTTTDPNALSTDPNYLNAHSVLEGVNDNPASLQAVKDFIDGLKAGTPEMPR
ncbi:hypothetical protein CCP4SC76_680003 [Gammaproteobacteria bacterium]